MSMSRPAAGDAGHWGQGFGGLNAILLSYPIPGPLMSRTPREDWPAIYMPVLLIRWWGCGQLATHACHSSGLTSEKHGAWCRSGLDPGLTGF